MHAAIMHNPENAPGLGGNALVDRKCITHNAWTLQRSVSPSATCVFLSSIGKHKFNLLFFEKFGHLIWQKSPRAVPITIDPLPTKETLTVAYPRYLGSCSGVQV